MMFNTASVTRDGRRLAGGIFILFSCYLINLKLDHRYFTVQEGLQSMQRTMAHSVDLHDEIIFHLFHALHRVS